MKVMPILPVIIKKIFDSYTFLLSLFNHQDILTGFLHHFLGKLCIMYVFVYLCISYLKERFWFCRLILPEVFWYIEFVGHIEMTSIQRCVTNGSYMSGEYVICGRTSHPNSMIDCYVAFGTGEQMLPCINNSSCFSCTEKNVFLVQCVIQKSQFLTVALRIKSLFRLHSNLISSNKDFSQ